jgi:hypothetical protein
VIHDDTLDPAYAVDDDERMMLQASLAGVAFGIDNKSVDKNLNLG